MGIKLNRATVAIQGFGNAGSIAAELLSQVGATIIAVSDSRGGVINRAGLNVPERSEEHTSELQSQSNLVCRLLLEKKKHRHVIEDLSPLRDVAHPAPGGAVVSLAHALALPYTYSAPAATDTNTNDNPQRFVSVHLA